MLGPPLVPAPTKEILPPKQPYSYKQLFLSIKRQQTYNIEPLREIVNVATYLN